MADIRDAVSTVNPLVSESSEPPATVENTLNVGDTAVSTESKVTPESLSVVDAPSDRNTLFSHAPAGFYADIRSVPTFKNQEKPLKSSAAYNRRDFTDRLDSNDFISKIACELERRLRLLDERMENYVIHPEFQRPWSYDGRTWHNITV
ncbi:hypothetical protein RvY_15068 [Ramazzottius varieornatus]|uniref:Uncharacterized protein n=1 Tax=Ramazzottius varieornatus TaxID=947166 RepID=A0A1D1VTK3_RAMVA|nr:hypothetical protein RvY_15068 [Ramazzottius varieornatus]